MFPITSKTFKFLECCLCLWTVLPCFNFVSAGRILAYMTPGFSHLQPIIPTLEELHDKYGHTSTVILSELSLAKQQLINTSIQYIISENLNKYNSEYLLKIVLKINLDGDYSLFPKWLQRFSQACSLLLSDWKLISTIQEKSFDLILMEKTPSALCLNVIAYNLSIPFMFYGQMYDPIVDKIPFLPSFVPAFPFVKYSDNMSFHQRVINTFLFLIRFFVPDMTSPANLFDIYAPNKPKISTFELWRQSRFNLFDTDVLIDYPRPMMPNSASVGGLGTRPALPLTGEFKTFTESTKNGVIIVSFGSAVSELKQHLVTKLLTAFKEIKHLKFIFKYGKTKRIEGNVLIMPWIPQNDLLGYENTKLFISHCGNGGQYEALYHGIPILAFPLFGDQMYNANRMETKGFGVIMDITNFEVKDLVNNINLMLNDQKYANAIKLASEIFHNRPNHPKEVAAYWIDHVFKYGGAHMKSSSLDMPFYQYILLDVILFFLFILILICVFSFFILKCCWKCLCGKKKSEKLD